jgi:hypothetical protein
MFGAAIAIKPDDNKNIALGFVSDFLTSIRTATPRTKCKNGAWAANLSAAKSDQC